MAGAGDRRYDLLDASPSRLPLGKTETLARCRLHKACLTAQLAVLEGAVPSRVAAAATSQRLLRPPGERADFMKGGEVGGLTGWLSGPGLLQGYITARDYRRGLRISPQSWSPVYQRAGKCRQKSFARRILEAQTQVGSTDCKYPKLAARTVFRCCRP